MILTREQIETWGMPNVGDIPVGVSNLIDTARASHGSGHQVVNDVDVARLAWARAVARGAVDVSNDDPEACWEWAGIIHTSEYGQIVLPRMTYRVPGRKAYAHIVALVAHSGELVPERWTVDHLCRNTRCCRPSHLRAVPQRDNMLAPGSRSVSAASAAKERCPNGHLLTPVEGVGRARRWCGVCRRRGYFIKRGLVAAAARSQGLSQVAYAEQYGEGRAAALSLLGPEVLPALEREALTRYPDEED